MKVKAKVCKVNKISFFNFTTVILKKKQVHASEQKRPDVEEARKVWQEEQNDSEKFPAEHLVFLDESGVNIDMIRRYGRARKNSVSTITLQREHQRKRHWFPLSDLMVHWRTNIFKAL